jgi:hypothetical protein
MRGRVPCRQEHETPSVASTAFNIGPAVQRGACRMRLRQHRSRWRRTTGPTTPIRPCARALD